MRLSSLAYRSPVKERRWDRNPGASSLVDYGWRAVRSAFSEAKKASIAALSHTLPERLIEQTTP
jgi:hypothetical protein